MKILHVVNISFVLPYYIGGQFDYLINKGIQIYVACTPSEHLFEYSREKSFAAVPITILREISPWEDLKAIVRLRKIILNESIEIVVGHTPKGAMIAMIAASLAGVSHRIYFRHGLMYETSNGMKRLILKCIERLTGRLATKVICVSESVKNKSVLENLNSPSKNLILNIGTCNGIDIQKFSKGLLDDDYLNQLSTKYNILGDDFVVGYVGRLVCDKGISELIASWKTLLNQFTNIKLLLVGPFEKRDSISDELKEYIRKEPSVIHTGLISEVSPFYEMMDIFILPSYREGFPTVVLEASAMELPVITTKSTGCIDSIIENETGIFCEISPESISTSIQFYLDNKEIAKQHGRNGRTFVVSNFKQELIWKEIEDKVLELNK